MFYSLKNVIVAPVRKCLEQWSCIIELRGRIETALLLGIFEDSFGDFGQIMIYRTDHDLHVGRIMI